MANINTEILVIGGGTAGFGAAIAAARTGLTVYLMEAGNKIGGVMANCPGMPLGAAYPLNTSIGGVLEELASRLYRMDPPAAEKRDCSLHEFGPEILYDHEIAIFIMNQMLEEAGVNLMMNTLAIEPVLNGDKIEAIKYCDKTGQHEMNIKVLIDCSGDGDISAKAGVPFQLGDEQGRMMGVTETFLMIDADWEKIFSEEDPYFTKYASKGVEEGRIHEDIFKLYIMKGFHKDTVYFNSVVVKGVDGTNPMDVARATQEGQRRCHELAKFVREEIPGFENANMIYLGPSVGVRETRKFVGDYHLTGEDLYKATKFPDGIVCCDNPIDDVMRGSNEMTHESIVENGSYYTIPFRSLIPKKIKNLMFAGRNISADSVAFASVRGMPQCMLMGQAVGTAANMVIQNGISVQEIDTDELVKKLQDQGVNGLGDSRL